jgi:hypothetical protein
MTDPANQRKLDAADELAQLAAADVVLSDEVLDRIDEINPPGVTINRADSGLDPVCA